MEKRPHFAAFISHRSVDKKAVFKIQKKLEHYSIGKDIREKYGIGRKSISPVCVDTYEFTSNELKKEIDAKLDDSEKMILICSYSSASPIPGRRDWSAHPEEVEDWSQDPSQTGWVGYEIDYMLRSGRQGDIIPVIIEGDPEKGDCFHPLIKDLVKNDLTYFDFSKGDKTERLTFLKLVGAILGIKNLGELFDHDAKRKRIRTACAAALAFAILGAGAWSWSYFLPHEQHFSDYVVTNGLPEGINRLSSSNISQTAEHYVIKTTKAAHRIELSHVNTTSGTPVEDISQSKIDAPMIAVYQCRSNWNPDTVEFRDRNGIVQMTYAYSTDMRYVTFQENEYTSDQVYPSTEVDEYGVPVRMKIDSYDMSYDENGRVIRRMYMSGVNYVINETGSAGEQYTYDDIGRITNLRYLNRRMEIASNQNGVAGFDYEYDDNGRLVKATTVNTNGDPVYGTEWYASVRYTYSGKGQIVTSTYYTPEGAETVCKDGYSRATREYDEKGNKLSEFFTGIQGEPLYSSGKYHKALYTYNERGDMISASYFDENGNALIHGDGYSSIAWERDRNGNAVKTSYFSTEGTLMPSSNYAAVIERRYDNDGYMTEEKNYGVNGQAVITSDGYFRKTVSYDDKGKPRDISVYGLNDNPVYNTEKYHRMHFDYDDRGNLGRITLYGTFGQLIPFPGEWAVQNRTYNGGGQVETVSFFDQYNKPVVAKGLYASLVNTYDDRGLLTSTSYYDAGGRLTSGSAYIEAGVVVGDRYYGKVEYDYDENGNNTLIVYTPGEGEVLGIAPTTKIAYDEAGRALSWTTYESDGQPTKEIAATHALTYDSLGHVMSHAFFDAEGRPANGIAGYCVRYVPKDFRGNVVESVDTDANGRIIGDRITYEYDERGLQVSAHYIDDKGNAVINDRGYSALMIENDSAGRQVRLAAVDDKGRPVDRAEGYSIKEQSYDAGGNIVSTRYFDSSGMPTDVNAGFHGCSAGFNDYRQLTYLEYFDKDDTVLFRYTADYKDYVYLTEEAVFGRNGEPIEAKGFHISRVVNDYDDHDQKTGSWYYDKKGNLKLLFFEFAGWSSEYENGLEVSRTYYGNDGKPVMINTGFASVTMERNELGQEIRRTYYDAEGKPTDNVFGFNVMAVTYGEDGEIATSEFYDTEGRRVVPDGKASLESMFLYDDVKEEEVYDPDTGEKNVMYFSVGSYNVRLLAFRASNGKTDQFAQPRFSLYAAADVSEYINMSEMSYIPQITEDDETIDVNDYENADDWEETVGRYVQALEEGNAGQLVELMDLSSVEGTIDELNAATNTPHTAEELVGFYRGVWQTALDDMFDDLSERYGEDFSIDHEYINVSELDRETVDAVNKRMREISDTANEYLAIVQLTVRYTVTGSRGSGMETKGFFTPDLTLFKTEKGWTIGTGNGFPGPTVDEIVAFFGGIKRP